MKHFKALIPAVIALLMAGCVPIRERIGMRGPIKPEELAFMEKKPVSREDVLLHLGIPEETLYGERIFDYKWIESWDIESLIIQSGSVATVQKCNIVRFYFDENGTVENMYTHSYKPKPPLADNRQCLFTGISYGQIPARAPFPGEDRTRKFPVIQGMNLVVGSRTHAHISLGYQDSYDIIISDLISFLQSKGILLSCDRVVDIPRFDEPVQYDALLHMAAESNAESILQIIFDKPPSTWITVMVRYFDRNGRMLWSEGASASEEMQMGEAVRRLEQKLSIRIMNHSLPSRPGTVQAR